MRSLVIIAVCVAAPGVLAFADTELDKFQGTWQAEKLSSAGVDAKADQVAKLVITFKGDQAIPKDNPADIAKVRVDPMKKPAEIDFTDKDNKVNRGIYRFIDKDTVEICMNLIENAARPKDFTSPKDSMFIVMVLKRAKQ